MLDSNLDPVQQIRWLVWTNQSAEECPPFGAVRVTGADSNRDLQGNKPNANGQAVWINGPTPVPAGSTGLLTNDFPVPAYYDAADGTPANNETWGAGTGTWKLKKNQAGFTVVGGAADSRVMVTRPLLDATGSDVFVKVTSSDTTASYLGSKLSAGTNISFATLNPAGNEQLQINCTYAYALSVISGALGTGDSSYSNANVTSITINMESGLSVTDSGGNPLLALAAASYTHAGAINLTDVQWLGNGGKVIDGWLFVNGPTNYIYVHNEDMVGSADIATVNEGAHFGLPSGYYALPTDEIATEDISWYAGAFMGSSAGSAAGMYSGFDVVRVEDSGNTETAATYGILWSYGVGGLTALTPCYCVAVGSTLSKGITDTIDLTTATSIEVVGGIIVGWS